MDFDKFGVKSYLLFLIYLMAHLLEQLKYVFTHNYPQCIAIPLQTWPSSFLLNIPWILTNLESNRIYSSWSILWHTCWNSWSKFSLTITHNALLSLSKLDQALSCLIFHGLWQIWSQIASTLPDLSYGTPVGTVEVSFHSQLPTMHCYPSPNLTKLFLA